ncbi:MAG: hypothetical protein U1E27_06425 [Kiritimatiellia bacterium]|nr:hypothetical protein [Kiritimatiellia bacterium]
MKTISPIRFRPRRHSGPGLWGLWIALALCALMALPAQARLGENQQAIHRRLRSKNSGDLYEKEIQETKAKQGPFTRMLPMLETARLQVEIRVWWKNDKDSRLRDTDLSRPRALSGWDYFVVFINGESVLEGFRRNTGNISLYERDALLKLNFRAESYKEHKQPLLENSFFTWQFESEDGTARGVLVGANQLMVFSTAFDQRLAELNQKWKLIQDEEAKKVFQENIFGF